MIVLYSIPIDALHGRLMKDVPTETDVHLPSSTRLLKLHTSPGGMMGFCFGAVSHLEHCSLRLSQFIERWFPSCHLYDGAAQRPDVRRLAISSRTLVNDFWSHVLQCAWTKQPKYTDRLLGCF